MENNTVGERVSRVETRMDMIEKRVEKFEDTTNLIHKMNVLLEVQVDSNKKLQSQTESLQEIIRSVNDNLTNLNNRYDSLDERVDKIESDNIRIIKDDTISINGIIQNVVKWFAFALPLVVLGGLATYYLNQYLGK